MPTLCLQQHRLFDKHSPMFAVTMLRHYLYFVKLQNNSPHTTERWVSQMWTNYEQGVKKITKLVWHTLWINPNIFYNILKTSHYLKRFQVLINFIWTLNTWGHIMHLHRAIWIRSYRDFIKKIYTSIRVYKLLWDAIITVKSTGQWCVPIW